MKILVCKSTYGFLWILTTSKVNPKIYSLPDTRGKLFGGTINNRILLIYGSTHSDENSCFCSILESAKWILIFVRSVAKDGLFSLPYFWWNCAFSCSPEMNAIGLDVSPVEFDIFMGKQYITYNAHYLVYAILGWINFWILQNLNDVWVLQSRYLSISRD